jgi:type I restriction enzyme S subunit
LWFYFLSAEGLEKLGKASPGGAGRNRTLGLEALSNITVPVPEHEKQLWFEEILEKANGVREIQQRAAENVEVVLMPAVLSKAFAKEL